MFKPITNRWIKIKHTASGHPYFNYHGRRVRMDHVIRTHNNPWISDVYPEYIHGYEAENYFDPFYIQIREDGGAVKIYTR